MSEKATSATGATRAARAQSVPIARLFAPTAPEGPPPEAVRAAEREAACALARAQVHEALGPRISQLEAELAAERAARTAEASAQRALAEAAIADLQACLAGAVASLGLAVARQVIAAEPAMAEETLAALVAQALAHAPDGACGTLRLHPLHLSAAPPMPSGWRLVPDADCSPGTVIAEAGPWLALGSLDLRLEQARDALEGRP